MVLHPLNCKDFFYVRPAQGIYQPHRFDCAAGGLQQQGVCNENGQTSGPGQGHIEPFSAEQKIQVPGWELMTSPVLVLQTGNRMPSGPTDPHRPGPERPGLLWAVR